MIIKNYKEGNILDVAGLNEITVLYDRADTEYTEIGHNEWRPHLDGPPHYHDEKDQAFYITSGVGIVKLGDEQHDVKEGCLCFVPAGLEHQTITTSDEPLCYLLFNIYNSNENITFEQHIEKVRSVRKAQAETQSFGESSKITEGKRPAKFFDDIGTGKQFDFVSSRSTLLVDRSESERMEILMSELPADLEGPVIAHPDKEQTFLILEGDGSITIDGESSDVKVGDVVFLPSDEAHSWSSGKQGLKYICQSTYVEDPLDDSFEEMHARIAPDRIRRSEEGSSELGE